MPGLVTTGSPADALPQGAPVTACDREPIHLPGSIQPHGMILVADPVTLRIVAGAGEIETLLAPHWLGLHLDEILRHPVSARLADPPGRDPGVTLRQIEGIDAVFDATIHRSPTAIIVELEPAPPTMPSPIEMLAAMENAAATFEHAFGLRELCERAARIFRQVTGFDRVMV